MNAIKRTTSGSLPCLSVILTVYKRTEYLAEALDSVLRQSYRNFEIIVADDSGTEAARDVLVASGHFEGLRYLPHPATIGIAASLVRSVREAKGELIAVLNDDDLWEPDLLERLVPPLLADPNRVLANADHWIMDANGRIDESLSEKWTVNFGRSSLGEGVVPNSSVFAVVNGGAAVNIACIFRKDALDWSLVVPEVKGAYDYWISCLLAATRRPFYHIPKRLARWRVHGKMETERRSHDKNENLVYIYSTLLERRWFPELANYLKTKLADSLFEVARDKLLFDRASEARTCFWRCFLIEKSPRAFIRTVAVCLPRAARMRLKSFINSLRIRATKRHKPNLPVSSALYSSSVRKEQ
jgi:glycosyltransferase involved in cell wall biosynthesis